MSKQIPNSIHNYGMPHKHIVQQVPHPVVQHIPHPVVQHIPHPVVQQVPHPVVQQVPQPLQTSQSGGVTTELSRGQPVHRASSADEFKNMNFQDCVGHSSVSVPKVSYTLVRQPVVYEEVKKSVEYIQMPVQYSYDKVDLPSQRVYNQCCPEESTEKVVPKSTCGRVQPTCSRVQPTCSKSKTGRVYGYQTL